MRVQVLDEATADLASGFRFYERQADGLGDYFLDSLWSDIHSLRFYGGIHPIHRLAQGRLPRAERRRPSSHGCSAESR